MFYFLAFFVPVKAVAIPVYLNAICGGAPPHECTHSIVFAKHRGQDAVPAPQKKTSISRDECLWERGGEGRGGGTGGDQIMMPWYKEWVKGEE